MFVTTAGRTNQEMINKANEIATNLRLPYIPRRKQSINQLQDLSNSDCLVVGKERLELFERGSSLPFFFHPNSAMFRIKRLQKGDYDPFTEAAQLSSGMTFIDCTLGLASDAIVASYLVGREGQVIGIEGQKYLAYIVQEGLRAWDSGIPIMNKAMENISVIHSMALEYLKTMEDESADCVYFDPMFEETVLESNGIKGLGQFAIHDDLSEETIREALRVAKKRVLVKDHYKSHRFERYNFQVIPRKTAKFHFGFIDKN